MKRLGVLVLPLMLGACQLASINDNPQSPFYPPPVGSKLTLKKDIQIPPDNAGVMLQGGQIMSNSGVNQYQPNCRFELNSVSPTEQSVKADVFTITEVKTNSYQVMAPSSGFVKVGLNMAATLSMFNYYTLMRLSSTNQPQVRSLTCQQWGDPAFGKPVSIDQMRMTLGDYFDLELPAGTPGAKK